MHRYLRTFVVVACAMAAMAAIGFSYERCIGPTHPVWDSRAKVWPTTPVTVYWVKEFWGDAHSESFETALWAVNSEVKFELLAATVGNADVTINTADGSPCSRSTAAFEEEHAAEAWLCGNGTVEIQIYSPGTNNCSARIAMHELGHALGLAHTAAGIMRPKVGCDDLLIFSDGQRAALKARYGKP